MTEADGLRTHADLFYGALKSGDWYELAAIYSGDYMLVRPDGSVLSRTGLMTFMELDHGAILQKVTG